MLKEFMATHEVFTVKELDQYLSLHGSGNQHTRKALLAYYQKQGRLISVKRGLFAVVPYGGNQETNPVDPYLVAAKSAPDAVLAYHTALEFHGKAYSAYNTFHFVSKKRLAPFKFRFYEFKAVQVPRPLVEKGKEMFGVTSHKRSGVEVRVTSLERTLVDVMDRPHVAGSWEEIWRSLESVEFFNLEVVVEYVRLLNNATTAAKVGFFLDQHKNTLMVDDAQLQPLRKLLPRRPHYLIRGNRKGSRLVKDWNLMAPEDIMNQSWGEVI